MAKESYPLLLIFVDGIGLAAGGADNPFDTVPTPGLDSLLGGPLTLESVGVDAHRTLVALDACLGIDGLPQSATGQTTLLTGVNAQHEIGHHVPALPGTRLREILREQSVFKKAVAKGWRTTFANPYTATYLKALDTGERRPSATTCAVSYAGVRLRRENDLARDEAVTWDMCRDRFTQHAAMPLRTISARDAGCHLAALAARYDFTLYETFLTDLAGHGRTPIDEAVQRLDELIAGVASQRDARLSVIVTSDHGNLEDASTKAHTRNAVPLLAFGPAAKAFAALDRLDQVTPRLLTIGVT